MPSDIILNEDDTEIVGNVRLTRTSGGQKTGLSDAMEGNIWLGGNGTDGDLVARDGQGRARVHIDTGHTDPTTSDVRVYVSGRRGNITLGAPTAPMAT